MSKRLYRSRKNRQITGVLGGVAEYFSLDASWVRIGYVVLMVLTGFFPLIFLYILMVLIVPAEPKASSATEQ